jgi:hypothetical protein
MLCLALCLQLDGEVSHKEVTIQELQVQVQAAQVQAQEASEMMAAMASAHKTEVASLQDKLHAAQAQAQEAGDKMAAMSEGHQAQMSALQATLANKTEALQASMMKVRVSGQWSAAVHYPCFICFCLLLACMLNTCGVRQASHGPRVLARPSLWHPKLMLTAQHAKGANL